MSLKLFLCVFVTFLFKKKPQKRIFFFGPFTLDFANSMTIINKTTKCWVDLLDTHGSRAANPKSQYVKKNADSEPHIQYEDFGIKIMGSLV